MNDPEIRVFPFFKSFKICKPHCLPLKWVDFVDKSNFFFFFHFSKESFYTRFFSLPIEIFLEWKNLEGKLRKERLLVERFPRGEKMLQFKNEVDSTFSKFDSVEIFKRRLIFFLCFSEWLFFRLGFFFFLVV